MGFIVVGDTSEFKDCLVSTFNGKWTEEEARKVLERMINAPTENDKLLTKGHTNLRLKKTEPKDEWWNYPFLAN